MLCGCIELVVFVAASVVGDDVDRIGMRCEGGWTAQRLMMDDEAHVCLRGSGRLPASFAFRRGTGQWQVGVEPLKTHICWKAGEMLLIELTWRHPDLKNVTKKATTRKHTEEQ